MSTALCVDRKGREDTKEGPILERKQRAFVQWRTLACSHYQYTLRVRFTLFTFSFSPIRPWTLYPDRGEQQHNPVLVRNHISFLFAFENNLLREDDGRRGARIKAWCNLLLKEDEHRQRTNLTAARGCIREATETVSFACQKQKEAYTWCPGSNSFSLPPSLSSLNSYYKQILLSLWLLLLGTTLLVAGFVLLFTNERKSHCKSQAQNLEHPTSCDRLAKARVLTHILSCLSSATVRAGLLCTRFHPFHPWSLSLENCLPVNQEEKGMAGYRYARLISRARQNDWVYPIHMRKS